MATETRPTQEVAFLAEQVRYTEDQCKESQATLE